MKKLWDKGQHTDHIMHRLTVGNDPVYDQKLIRWDCLGCMAHAKTLRQIGILSADELHVLRGALSTLLKEIDAGEITVSPELEDSHTTIESLLVTRIGDIGKKLHTGRSRNDQVLLAMRLFLRQTVLDWTTQLFEIGEIIIARYSDLHAIPLPGYTHLQPAMPASLGMWLHAFLEGCLTRIHDGVQLLNQLDTSPLGAAAGFGSSLPIDREYVAQLLHFSRAGRSFIDIQNSRGQDEERLLFWAAQIGTLWEKFAWDVMLYATQEYGFFSLPDAFTTGSSIMPQKKNLDIVELLRGRSAKMRGYLSQLQWVIAKLPSNYHRDLQLTKEPVYHAIADIQNVVDSVKLILGNLQVHPENIEKRMVDELYATYAAYRLVYQGIPFRDAYQEIATLCQQGNIAKHDYETEFARIQKEVDHYFKETCKDLSAQKQRIEALQKKLVAMESTLFEVS